MATAAESRPTSQEALKAVAREKATTAWTNLNEGLHSQTISPVKFLNETRTLLDHRHALSKGENAGINKAFAELRKHGQVEIVEQIKPILLDQITSHTAQNEKQLDRQVAEILGFLGNRVGLGADTDISKALGADSPVRRKQITAVAQATLVAAAIGNVTVGGLGLLEASTNNTQESPDPTPTTPSVEAPTPAPALKPAATGTAVPPTSSPVTSPTSSPVEVKPSPTPSIEKPTPPTKLEDLESREDKEALNSPKSEYLGFRVNSVEAIKNLPPTIKIIRIGGDTNRMNDDGSYISDPEYDYEGMLEAADKKGLEVVFTYKASWFPGIEGLATDEDLGKTSTIIGNHMRNILKHPSIKYFEVGNEIDQGPHSEVQFWQGTMEDYGLLFKMVLDNLPEINQTREKPVEPVLTSFADIRSIFANTDQNLADFVSGLQKNGVDPGQFLVAGHAYHPEDLAEILDSLQQKVGAKGVIITEFNVSSDNKRKPAVDELKEMVDLIEQRKVIAIAHEFENTNPTNTYSLEKNDPRFKVIMNAVEREIDQAKTAEKDPKTVLEKRTEQKEPEKEPPKKGEVLYPPELSLEEFKEWEQKHKEVFDSVITESLFTKELGPMTEQKRHATLEAIANAHAKAIVDHYGDTDAIIGLDPGHGVDSRGHGDVGSATTTGIPENQLTWEIAQMIAPKIMELSKNRYNVVFLRPEHPQIRDMNGDGAIENWDNIRQRKLVLAKEVARLRPDENDRQRDIFYCSVHLNGSEDGSQTGTEVIYPHEVGVSDPQKRLSSKSIAEQLQNEIIESLKNIGHPIRNRQARADSGPKSYVALLA